jgi:arginine decarboxylase
MFLTKGVGVHRHALTAFEFALRDADIEQQNLVYVSSILPPRCEVMTREAGVELLRPGDITFCVMARSETNEFGRHLYASLGLAKSSDRDMYGYISEGAWLRHDRRGQWRTGRRPGRDHVGLDTWSGF